MNIIYVMIANVISGICYFLIFSVQYIPLCLLSSKC